MPRFAAMNEPPRNYDAILLVSFGGPEAPDDVMPFLQNVTRGRSIPQGRLQEVARHYYLFGGVSPINAQCRDLLSALQAESDRRDWGLPVYWGNRNWHPMLADTLRTMAADGVQRVLAVATAAFSSYAGCRQYLTDIEAARAAVGTNAPQVAKVPPYWNMPGFLQTMADNTAAALAEFGADGQSARLVFTAHSIPLAMETTCSYLAELQEATKLIAERVPSHAGHDLVFQSRSGPPTQPWLEPDINDHLRSLHESGTRHVVLVPLGFVSDHMEVVYDLDTQARKTADELGLAMTRAATVGSQPSFVTALADLLAERMAGRESVTLGTRGAAPFPCAPGCCAYTPAPQNRVG